MQPCPLLFWQDCPLPGTLHLKPQSPSTVTFLGPTLLYLYGFSWNPSPGVTASGLRRAEPSTDPERGQGTGLSWPQGRKWEPYQIYRIGQAVLPVTALDGYMGTDHKEGFRFCLEKPRLHDVCQHLISKGGEYWQTWAAIQEPPPFAAVGGFTRQVNKHVHLARTAVNYIFCLPLASALNGLNTIILNQRPFPLRKKVWARSWSLNSSFSAFIVLCTPGELGQHWGEE